MAMMYAERAPSRQIAGATAVIGVHAALIFALVAGLAERETIEPRPNPEFFPVPIPEDLDPVPPAPRPDVDEYAGPVVIAEPDWVPDVVPDDDVIKGLVTGKTTDAPTGDAPSLPQPLPLRSDPLHPLAPPEYPASAIRRNQEGIVQLLIYVLPNGNVADVKIGRSSGYPLLDEAAVRKARAAWRFLPATSGSGQAIAAWGTFDVRFELKIN